MSDDEIKVLLSLAEWLIQSKDLAGALSAYNKAIRLNDENADAVHNRGILLAELGRLEEAITDYDRALSLRPVFPPALRNRGNALCLLGRYEDALVSFDKCLEQRPAHVETLCVRSWLLSEMGLFEDALAGCDLALKMQPGHFPILLERANVLCRLSRFDEALLIYQDTLSVAPNRSDIYCRIGVALTSLGRFVEAIDALNKALEISPDNAFALLQRGDLLRKWNRATEAIEDYTVCIEIRSPYQIDALVNRGLSQWEDKGHPELAISDFESALKINPDYPYLRGRLLHAKLLCASWSNFERDVTAINNGVRAGKKVVRPYVYQAISELPGDLQKCAQILAKDFFPYNPMASQPPQKTNKSGKRIRVGYCSGEFIEHATSHLMAGLYEHHDRSKFEIVAVDNGIDDGSPMRRRLQKSFDEFIDIRTISDDAAARKIREAEIDILVNLNGYFGGQRMGVFARRPSPIQVNYLGWPGTLGAPYIDYIVADRTVIPESDAVYYDEKVVYLPNSYQANDSRRPTSAEIPTRESLGLPRDAFVFCNFNAAFKLVPSTFKVWMEIMKEVKDSVLWLLRGNATFTENVKREAAFLGIESHRIIFAPFVSSEENLSRLALADLFLDSLPYNGHTTASDALWAGVPLITCRGKAFSGRVGASLLYSVGLPELVTETISEYKALAVRLASNADTYGKIVKNWRAGRIKSALFDTELFARHIEAAYRSMWDNVFDASNH
jgi:protein O-GlcNAc transferase